MAVESAIFRQKVLSQIFQTLTHQISLLTGLHTLSWFYTLTFLPKKLVYTLRFFTKKLKATYSTTLNTYFLYFKFQLNRDKLPLTFVSGIFFEN